MKYYLDTSSLVALYIPEKHSQAMLDFAEKMEENLYISRLVEVEFYSALTNKFRTKIINQLLVQEIIKLFDLHIYQRRFQKLYLTDETFSCAISYLQKNTPLLRTLDALHLACAELNKATLITSDKILFQCAKQLRVPTELI